MLRTSRSGSVTWGSFFQVQLQWPVLLRIRQCGYRPVGWCSAGWLCRWLRLQKTLAVSRLLLKIGWQAFRPKLHFGGRRALRRLPES